MDARAAANLLFIALMVLTIALISFSCISECYENCYTVCQWRECEEYCSQYKEIEEAQAACLQECFGWDLPPCRDKCTRECAEEGETYVGN